MCEDESTGGLDRRGFFGAAGILGAGVAAGVAGVSFGPRGLALAAPTPGWSNPAVGTLTSGYKTPERPTHTGWDVAVSGGHVPVFATANGTVRDIRTGSYPGDPASGPLPGRSGNSVHLNHANSYFSYYGHLATVLVSKGQQVSCGQVVGIMGTTGQSTGDHLHFEVHHPRLSSVNPRTFLSGRGITLGSTAPVGTAGWPADKKGASGARVKVLQRLLVARGRSVVIDGDFGTVTDTVVKAYQTATGLWSDGEVGKYTWTCLILPVRPGANGNMTKALQEALVARGHTVTINGTHSTALLNAVKAFQSANGLVADGDCGPLTWAALV